VNKPTHELDRISQVL